MLQICTGYVINLYNTYKINYEKYLYAIILHRIVINLYNTFIR